MKYFISVTFFLSCMVCYAESKKLPADSIFHIQTKWTNQDGKNIRLESFAGKPTIVSMVYLSCQYLCPTIISEVQNLESKLDLEKKEKIQVVLFSFDSEKDTPEMIKSYVKKRKLNNARWTFLTSKTDAAPRELAAVFDFKYKKIDGGDFTHSFMIMVLDKSGVPVARIDSANQDKQPLVDALNKLLEK